MKVLILVFLSGFISILAQDSIPEKIIGTYSWNFTPFLELTAKQQGVKVESLTRAKKDCEADARTLIIKEKSIEGLIKGNVSEHYDIKVVTINNGKYSVSGTHLNKQKNTDEPVEFIIEERVDGILMYLADKSSETGFQYIKDKKSNP